MSNQRCLRGPCPASAARGPRGQEAAWPCRPRPCEDEVSGRGRCWRQKERPELRRRRDGGVARSVLSWSRVRWACEDVSCLVVFTFAFFAWTTANTLSCLRNRGRGGAALWGLLPDPCSGQFPLVSCPDLPEMLRSAWI